MNLREIAKNINKVRMPKLKRLARYSRIDVLENKSRKEIIDEIKSSNMYKKLMSSWDKKKDKIREELEKSLYANRAIKKAIKRNTWEM